MMDESPLEDMHIINEKQSMENSHVVEAIPFEEEVKKLDPVFVLGPGEGKKPFFFATHEKGEILSPAEERRVHYTLPSPLHFKPFIRKKDRQKEIVFNRECKKLEKVWTNRGLPVDRETVCSAVSKDAFDLKDLSESLPSTSTSVNKPSIIKFETGCRPRSSTGIGFDEFHRRFTDMDRMIYHVFPTFNARNFTHSCKATMTRLPVSETVPSACNSQMETVQRDELIALVKAQRWIRWKRWTQSQKKIFHPFHSEKSDCAEQKEESEDSLLSRVKKVLSNMTHVHQELSRNPHSITSEQLNFGSEFAKMSIDDKQDEKKKETQDSDDENHLPSPVLNPLPLMTNYVPKSSWDSDKNWNAKFNQIALEFSDFPGPVPFNSPMKKEENAGKNDLFWSMEKELAEARLNALKDLREQNKLKTLNSYRRIFPGDEDSSESEKPSLEDASRVFYQKVPKVNSSTQTERIILDKLKLSQQSKFKLRESIREMKESVKNVRTIYVPFSRRRIVKSDKVVPD